MKDRAARTQTQLLTAVFLLAASPQAGAATLIDYFQPMPIIDKLTSSTWGAANALPRDVKNGLEDVANDWCYWDGKIIKAKDGKYHLFGSRWSETVAHNDGWMGSVAIHAVSDNVLGPYLQMGVAYSNQSGNGHNVTADILPDGRYVLLVSETRPGDIFISASLDGPWIFQGSIKIDLNGVSAEMTTSNLSLVVRPDGNFMMISRHGFIMLSTSGIMGPYKLQGPSIYPTISGLNNANAEDPVIWYSGGQYHVTVNWWDARKAYHLTSTDGIKNWKNAGLAYDPTRDFLRYSDGTLNHWNKIERPGVVMDNGHVSHFTFAVVDVPKEQELANDNHGSKIIVVPFDGLRLDAETGLGGTGGGGGIAGSTGGRGGSGGGAGGVASGSGGSNGSGGSTASGGATASGGTTGSGGASASGGGGSGGANASGGASALGGRGGAGPSGTSGTVVANTGGASALATGGAPAGGTGGPLGAIGGSGPGINNPAGAGCACAIEPAAPRTPPASLLVAVGALGAVVIRRRRRL